MIVRSGAVETIAANPTLYICQNVKSGCWLWTRAADGKGYGQFRVNGRQHRAHRIFYEMFVGRIPRGLQIDHLCRVTRCVNPDHLEAVLAQTNMRRSLSPAGENAKKTSCIHGHLLAGSNVQWTRSGRKCVECGRKASREYQKRKRAVR